MLEVEEGSKPVREGVRRALRFWVMESSITPRERRRKSRRADDEKQNWGVRAGGGGGGWLMISGRFATEAGAASTFGAEFLDQNMFARMSGLKGWMKTDYFVRV